MLYHLTMQINMKHPEAIKMVNIYFLCIVLAQWQTFHFFRNLLWALLLRPCFMNELFLEYSLLQKLALPYI